VNCFPPFSREIVKLLSFCFLPPDCNWEIVRTSNLYVSFPQKEPSTSSAGYEARNRHELCCEVITLPEFQSTADRAFLSSLHGNLSSSPSTSSPNQPSDKSSSCSRLLFKIPTKFVVKLRLSKRNIFPFNEFGIQLGGNLIKSSRR
jgi:hypothetical protein